MYIYMWRWWVKAIKKICVKRKQGEEMPLSFDFSQIKLIPPLCVKRAFFLAYTMEKPSPDFFEIVSLQLCVDIVFPIHTYGVYLMKDQIIWHFNVYIKPQFIVLCFLCTATILGFTFFVNSLGSMRVSPDAKWSPNGNQTCTLPWS